MKKILIINLIICLIISICYNIYLKNKYTVSETFYSEMNDSLCTVINTQTIKYDSLKIISDSLYAYELSKNDSLWQLLQINQKTNKSKITYVYKDSIIIKEVENTEQQTNIETKYVDKIVEKEVLQVFHDTIMVSKIDTIYNEKTTETSSNVIQNDKNVFKNPDLFNIFIDANVKANLDYNIIPEANVGIIIKEKFYGAIGIDYNEQVNPFIKAGIKVNIL